MNRSQPFAAMAAALVASMACQDSPTGLDDGAAVASVVATVDSILIPALGFERRVAATAFGEGGQELTGVQLTWGSRDPAIAGVDAGGRVVGRSYGDVSIVVSAGGASDVIAAKVEQVPAVVEVSEPPDRLRAIGETNRLVVAAWDSAGTEIEELEGVWSSSDPSVAVVNGFGLMRATGPGAAVISWSWYGESWGVDVFVRQTPDFLWIHGGQSELAPGDTTTVHSSLRDPENEEIAGAVITWSTSDPEVATVSEAGLVTAVAGGNVVIMGVAEGLTGWRSLSVLPVSAPPGDLSASPMSLEADAFGQDFVLRAEVDDGVNPPLSVPASWVSRNTDIATVSGSVGTARGNGTTWLVAEYDGRTDSVSIDVDRVPVALDFQGVPERVVITFSDGVPVSPGTVDRLGSFQNVGITWTVRDSTVVHTSSAGIGARGKGETWVVAEAVGLTDSIHVTVDPYLSGDLEIFTLQDLAWFAELGIEELGGTLWIYQTVLERIDGLESLRTVGGDLWVKFNDQLVDMSGLGNLEVVEGNIIIEKNAGLLNPTLPSLAEASGLAVFDNLGSDDPLLFPALETITGALYLADSGPALTFPSLRSAGAIQVFLTGPDELSFPVLEAIYGDLFVVDIAETRLISAPSLWRVQSLTVRGNSLLEALELDGLSTVQGDVTIETNPHLADLNRLGLTSGVRDLRIRENDLLGSINGLRGLGDALGADPIVTGDLWIENNPSLSSDHVQGVMDFIQDKYVGSAFRGVSIGGNG